MIELQPGDVVIEVFPPPVLTGMQTGKMPVGIKATHKKTGLSVVCEDFRHQHRNREKALDELQRLVNSEPA